MATGRKAGTVKTEGLLETNLADDVEVENLVRERGTDAEHRRKAPSIAAV